MGFIFSKKKYTIFDNLLIAYRRTCLGSGEYTSPTHHDAPQLTAATVTPPRQKSPSRRYTWEASKGCVMRGLRTC